MHAFLRGPVVSCILVEVHTHAFLLERQISRRAEEDAEEEEEGVRKEKKRRRKLSKEEECAREFSSWCEERKRRVWERGDVNAKVAEVALGGTTARLCELKSRRDSTMQSLASSLGIE